MLAHTAVFHRIRTRRTSLQDDRSRCKDVSARPNPHAALRIFVVGKPGLCAGARFDDQFQLGFDKGFTGFGRESDATFAWKRLARDTSNQRYVAPP